MGETKMCGRSPAQHGQNLRDTTDRDLCRRIRANVEPERSVNARKFFFGNSAFPKAIENVQNFSPAANHPDVTSAALLDRGRQRFPIDFVIATDQDQRFVRLPLP
jgi:hypothetical protein